MKSGRFSKRGAAGEATSPGPPAKPSKLPLLGIGSRVYLTAKQNKNFFKNTQKRPTFNKAIHDW
jgi:hypothetical protein